MGDSPGDLWRRPSDPAEETRRRVGSPGGSVASSAWMFSEPTQTLIFLDWDDTLFPCTELFERWGLPRRSSVSEVLPEELERDLAKWRVAVQDYLSMVCSLSDRCVIVTNSTAPWVELCVDRFAPNLKPIFSAPSGPSVAYAGEYLRRARAAQAGSVASCCCPAMRMKLQDALQGARGYEERRAEMTSAKLQAMRHEATAFYSRYPGQTWKNIISLGDMKYERDALQELSASRVAAAVMRVVGNNGLPKVRRELLRTKACMLPGACSLGELTVWLRLFRMLLPALARFDGDLDLDLHTVSDPLPLLAKALGLPQLAHVHLPQLRKSCYGPEPPSRLGLYRLLCDMRIEQDWSRGSPEVGRVSQGDLVDVLEFATAASHGSSPPTGAVSRLIRGRLATPSGWMTLVDEDGRVLVEAEHDEPLEEALDDAAVAVQESMFFGPQANFAVGAGGSTRSPSLRPAGHIRLPPRLPSL